MDYVKFGGGSSFTSIFLLREMVCGYVATELCLGYSEAVKNKYSRRGLKIAKTLQKRGRGGGKHGYGNTNTQKALQGRQKEKPVYTGQTGGCHLGGKS